MQYEKLKSAHEHTLLRPDTYLGSVRSESRDEFIAIATDSNLRITKQQIQYTPAVLRLFIEALSNAIDNVFRSKQFDVPCKSIKINVHPETGEMSVWNDGLSIPIKYHTDGETWIPEMLFGSLFSSSNYNDQERRETSGRNGMGISLTNIFSTEFKVQLVDPTTEQSYSQMWNDNMKTKHKPIIKNKKKTKGYTQVSWIPDFAYFKLQSGFNDDWMNLIRRYVLDTAMIVADYKVSVYFNGTKLQVSCFKDYVKMYQMTDVKDILHLTGPQSECILIPSNEYECVSFVNGIHTKQGGIHVDCWNDTIFKALTTKLNTKYKQLKLTFKELKHYFKVFVKCSVPNPEFASQDKEKLVAPKLTTNIEPKHIQTLLKWSFIEDIERMVQVKELSTLKKSERKRGYTRIEGFDPANKAGGKDSMKCTLILCEGLSAKTYAVRGIQKGIRLENGVLLKGRDWFGIMPLRGKILNVRKSSNTMISANKEIVNIIQALGLQYGVDYSKDEHFQKLRYGRIMILTDQDVDGYHIMGLIINIFDFLFPELCTRKGFLMCMHTPIVKIQLKHESLRFYNLNDVKKFFDTHTRYGDVKYYKGLGTSSDKDVSETFGNRMIIYTMDEQAKFHIDKIFNKDDSNFRKKWMAECKHETTQVQPISDTLFSMNVSDFINNEFIQFSIDDCKRSIPSVVDGLKESNRKILYACILKRMSKPIKVAQLAGFVAEKTNYHHGEGCLFDTITNMAQDFVGSNNIALLYRDGQFGSRLSGGKDAANARYIFTQLSPITRTIYHTDDDPILDYLKDDQDTIEPNYYVPVIPMILVNGSNGIGTGWSSSVPCYHPKTIIQWIRCWLDNETGFPDLQPWYKGFSGTITRVSTSKYETCGTFHRDEKQKLHITELPIGKWTDTYKEFLEELLEQKHLKQVLNYSTPEKVHFVVSETNVGSLDTERLKLKSLINTNNLVLFNSHNAITKYDTIEDILREFCKVRLEWYTKRKHYILQHLETEYQISSNKLRFVKSVMSNELDIRKQSEETITQLLITHNYWNRDGKGFDYLLNLPMRSFSLDKIETLEKKTRELQQQVSDIRGTKEQTMWKQDLDDIEKHLEKGF